MFNRQYIEYKRDFKEYVIIIKSGSFYTCLNDDAIVMNNIFNYKINESTNFVKIGFPINSLNKVLNKLDNLSINYLVIDKDIINKQKNKQNNYFKFIAKNYNIYLHRINHICDVLKNNLSNENIITILDEMENILCMINC